MAMFDKVFGDIGSRTSAPDNVLPKSKPECTKTNVNITEHT